MFPLHKLIFSQESNCLAKKYLTEEIRKDLSDKATATGFTLLKSLQSGLINVDSSIGIYAGDADSYQVLSAIIDPVIIDYHGVSSERKPQAQLEDLRQVSLANLDPTSKYIRSTRVRVARNVEGFSFTNNIDLAQRRILEKKIVCSLSNLDAEFTGEYHSFENQSEVEIGILARAGMMFPKGDRFQEAGGFNADYPCCRGMFVADDRRLRVWLNEEDHMRIISQDNSADLASVYNHLVGALAIIGKDLSFVKNDNYGYLTSCPTNIGTTMRAGVHIQLPKLDRSRHLLETIVKKNDLQIRGTSGENTEVMDSVFDISNKRRLGISEFEIITTLHRGLQEIIAAEEGL